MRSPFAALFVLGLVACAPAATTHASLCPYAGYAYDPQTQMCVLTNPPPRRPGKPAPSAAQPAPAANETFRLVETARDGARIEGIAQISWLSAQRAQITYTLGADHFDGEALLADGILSVGFVPSGEQPGVAFYRVGGDGLQGNWVARSMQMLGAETLRGDLSDGISGYFQSEGAVGRQAYSGGCDVSSSSDALYFLWRNSDSETITGVGIRTGNLVSVGFAFPTPGAKPSGRFGVAEFPYAQGQTHTEGRVFTRTAMLQRGVGAQAFAVQALDRL
jgi:hypothetical protein